MTDQVTFEDLGLSNDILQCLTDKGFKIPTPIQAQTIPLLLNGENDIIGQAQTGTGKTAAFGLPVIERITPGKRKVQAIVVAPTRELASQVAEELESLKAGRDIRILPVYGGQGMDTQLRQLKAGVDIVVATPGRAIDHLNRKTLNLDEVAFVVLDEADEMLNMGFIEDIEEILTHCPEERRMLLFSATMPPRIKKLAEKFMGEYDIVRVKAQTESAETVEQVYYSVYERDKLRALRRLIDTEPEFYALVFCRTRLGADRLAEKLNGAGFDVEALHGEVSQAQRERVLAKFKKGHANILIATDVAARGIDINDLTHVINFDLPDNAESYVHRIGRTGRAGKKGKAISFVAPKDRHKIRQIMQLTKAPIDRLQFPFGQEVVERKKQVMIERVLAASEEETHEEFFNLAQQLIEANEADNILATLLKMHFGGKLIPDSYPALEDPEGGRGGHAKPARSFDSGRRPEYGNREPGEGGRRSFEGGGRRKEDGDRRRRDDDRRPFDSGRRTSDGERDKPDSARERTEREKPFQDPFEEARPEKVAKKVFEKPRPDREPSERFDGDRPEKVAKKVFEKPRPDREPSERFERDRFEENGKKRFEKPRPDKESSERFERDRFEENGKKRFEKPRFETEERRESFRQATGEEKENRTEGRIPFSKRVFGKSTFEGGTTEKKPFSRPMEKTGKKKFSKDFGKDRVEGVGKKEKFEGVGKADKPKKKFAKKKGKIKVFG